VKSHGDNDERPLLTGVRQQRVESRLRPSGSERPSAAVQGRYRQAVVRWRLSLEKTPMAVMTTGRSLPRPQAASSSLRLAERSRSASVNFYRQM